jgi:hypothetical protein
MRVPANAIHYPHPRPGQRENQPLAEHQPAHVAGPGAQRHAHPDLVPALPHEGRHHPVDPHGREHQRDGGEEAEQRRAEAGAGERRGEQLRQRRRFDEEQIRIHLPQRVADRGDQRGGSAPSAGPRSSAPGRRTGGPGGRCEARGVTSSR